jgi:formylglycine-generating enzyme required for sulfatase activity
MLRLIQTSGAALLLAGAMSCGAYSQPASFRDCPAAENCPEMVAIPASPPGTLIGSPATEDGRLGSEAQHPVTVQAFALGKYEVSVAEYMACVTAGGCAHPEWAEPGGTHNIETGSGVTYKSMAASIKGDAQPVVGVSWHNATAYATWLSSKTGKTYRLPSEAEWEYAARAGTSTRFWWGDEVAPSNRVMACCRGCGSEQDGKGLFPVTAFQANPFGLHNVNGNVWEWVADFYCEDFAKTPADGTPQSKIAACEEPKPYDDLRVFRGGSCFYEPRQMRSSMRLRNTPDFRNQTVGFRIARTLVPGEIPSANPAD